MAVIVFQSITLNPYGFPDVVMNAQAAVGPGLVFTVQPRLDGSARTVQFQMALTGGPTTVSVNLEISSDGGTTWNALASAILTQAVLVAAQQNVVGGLIYRLNLATLAGGTAPTVTVRASAS